MPIRVLFSPRHAAFVALALTSCLAPQASLAQITEANACYVTAAPEDSGQATVAIGCGCQNGDGTLPDSGDWGRGSASGLATVKALPGTICHMNVGNIYGGDGVKIDTCAHLQGRAGEVVDRDCDTISLIELMADHQCDRLCQEDSESEACKLCQGCGSQTGATACERQAAVVCPSDKYEVTCTQAPSDSVGCDCICRKKDVCAAQPPSCVEIPNIRADNLQWQDKNGDWHNCSKGNYASCTRCTDPYGGPSTGNCVVHPDHCNDGNDEADRARCLNVCSTGLLNLAAQAIAGTDVRTMTGDFNCTPKGEPCDGFGVSIAECPWLSNLNTFAGMEVCYQSDNTASVGYRGCLGGSPLGAGCANCMLDFVMSTHCGCGETWAVMDGIAYGDHRTIVFGQINQPYLEYVPDSGHRYVHGHYDVRWADGSTGSFPYDSEQFGNGSGSSCSASASCGAPLYGGTVVGQQEVCEGRHKVRVRQRAGCFAEAKALVCENAWAWGWASGQASGHGAATTDAAGASATGSGNNWQGRCDKQRRIVDLRRLSPTEVASDPLDFLVNADASCTLRPQSPPDDSEPGEITPLP
jgi:hypothetical protein